LRGGAERHRVEGVVVCALNQRGRHEAVALARHQLAKVQKMAACGVGGGQGTVDQIDVGRFVAGLEPDLKGLEQLDDWQAFFRDRHAALAFESGHERTDLFLGPAHPRHRQ
jgi:hypothetical protein